MSELNVLSPATPSVEQRFQTLLSLLDQIELQPDQTELLEKINALVHTLQEELIRQRQVEAALRDSEARYRRVLETALEGILIGDVEGQISYVNPRGAALLGYTPAEIMGHSGVKLILPDDVAAAWQRFDQIGQGESHTSEVRLRAKDGPVRWLRFSISPVLNEQGLCQGFLAMFADITGARQAAERAARLQAITAALAEALTPAQVAGVILDQALPVLNAVASTIYLLSDDGQELHLVDTRGYSPELIERWRRFPADANTAMGDAIRQGRPVLLSSQQAALAAYPHLAPDLAAYGNAWAALPLLAHGRATGVMGLTFAETHLFSPDEQEFMLILAGQCAQALERTRLYAGLAEAHALLDTIFHSAPIGLAFWDRELRFSRLNPALAEYNGLPIEAHLGKTPAELLPEMDGINQIMAMLRQVLETGQPLLNVEVSGETPARPGEQRTWLESWYPVWVDREIIGLGGVVQEITERKRMEEQLRTALAEKEALVKEVYHRVKNNLQGVYNLVDLQAQTLPDGTARRALEDTLARIRSMTLVHDKLSRSEDPTRLDFTGYIQSLAAGLLRSLKSGAGSIQLEVDFEELAIDPETATPLGIVVNELLTNALKHAFPPGLDRPHRVRLALRATGEQEMCLCVSDNGVGLPDGFDPAASTSLGLQLVTNLIQNMRGTLELERQGGTTFRIILPRTP